MGVSGAIIGAQATMAAASAYGQHKAGGAQENITKAEATITHAQQEFELSRKAAVESEEFRRNLATTVASASGRGGAGMARQFGSQAFSSYEQDIAALNRAYTINDIQKQNKLAQAAALKHSTSIGAVTGLAKDILGTASSAITGAKLDDLLKGVGKSGGATAFAPLGQETFASTAPFAPTTNLAGTKSGKWNPLLG